MFALLTEPYAMILVSMLLSVMNHMGRTVASMFYHEIIKIRDFVQESLIDINDKKSLIFQKKWKFMLNQQNSCNIRRNPWQPLVEP